MTRLTLKIEGQLVRQGLQDLSAEIPQIGRRGIRTVMDRIKRRMEAYPPEMPGQSVQESHPILGYTIRAVRYKRTGTLGRSWYIEEVDNGYAIGNTARSPRGRRYSRYVIGDAYGTGQARVHVGRWLVLRDVTEQEIEKLPPEIEDNISMVARRVGL